MWTVPSTASSSSSSLWARRFWSRIALVGVYIVRASLKPLAEMERTAAAIAGGDLTQRVPELDPRTELGRFSLSLNTMLAQIEAAFLARAASEARAVRSEERMRQFVADASHELRTPLTTIRGFAELFRQGAAEDPKDVMRRIEDEAARMGLLVEDLLLLARLDRERPLRQAPVALADVVRDAASSAHAVAPDRTVEVEIAEPDGPLVVTGDEARLRQVIDNLVTNALTHTPAGTPVTLRLRCGRRTPRRHGGELTRAQGSPRSRRSGCSSASTGWTRPARAAPPQASSDRIGPTGAAYRRRARPRDRRRAGGGARRHGRGGDRTRPGSDLPRATAPPRSIIHSQLPGSAQVGHSPDRQA